MAAITSGNIVSPGENLTTGDNFTELFLEKFGGEVAQAYMDEIVVAPRISTRTIKSGKQAQFPATGKLTASNHVRGTRFDEDGNLSELEFGERVISLDRPAFVSCFLDEAEEKMNHYDTRGPLATAMAQALAELHETRLMQFMILGADSATGAGGMADQGGGNDMVDVNADTNGADLVTAIEDQVEFWDSASVPQGGRFCVVKPAQYRLLVDQTDFHSMDIGNSGNGSLKKGTIGEIRGVTVLKSNLLPQTDTSTDTPTYAGEGIVNDYAVNAANVIAVFGTPRCVGQLSLWGFRAESKYKMELGGHLFKVTKAIGQNILREEDCGVLRTVAL